VEVQSAVSAATRQRGLSLSLSLALTHWGTPYFTFRHDGCEREAVDFWKVAECVVVVVA
jgi:hypothetical protein